MTAESNTDAHKFIQAWCELVVELCSVVAKAEHANDLSRHLKPAAMKCDMGCIRRTARHVIAQPTINSKTGAMCSFLGQGVCTDLGANGDKDDPSTGWQEQNMLGLARCWQPQMARRARCDAPAGIEEPHRKQKYAYEFQLKPLHWTGV